MAVPPRRVLLLAEGATWFLGVVGLVVWGTYHHWAAASARLDVARFVTHQDVASRAGTPDQSLWSPERIREYRASMTERSDGPLAVIRIPNLDIEAAVLPDSSDWALNRGVGWIEGTALPGQPGNVGIAGHRDGFFRGLKDVAQGDPIQLELPGRVEQYRVASVTIVKPEDVSVLDPTPEPSITLVTCYPFYFIGSAPERFIVKATRVASAN